MKCCTAMVLILGATLAFLPVISSAQMVWTCATNSAAWSPRCEHAAVVFDGKMWVLGGSYLNDVWWSTNGVDWTCATASADWSPRVAHEVVVLRDTMWLMGGCENYPSGPYLNDVWYSTDGANWTCAVDSADWIGRGWYGLVVYNNELWVIAGFAGPILYYLKDIWHSSDGVNWTCTTDSAPWPERCNHTVADFNNQIWIFAGRGWPYLRDVWYSSDGTSWLCATDTAQWSARRAHETVVFDNKMWVIGGGASFECNDVWYSTDGANWTCAVDSADWQPRGWHKSIVYDNRIWVIGGSAGTAELNDVWYSNGLGIEEQPIVKSIENTKIITATIFRGPIRLPESKECKVFDITGRIVEPDRIQPGIYFIEVDGVVTQKVVKVR